jgi:hypothetical protein
VQRHIGWGDDAAVIQRFPRRSDLLLEKMGGDCGPGADLDDYEWQFKTTGDGMLVEFAHQ